MEIYTYMPRREFIINRVKGRMVLDSRGNPTVEVEVTTIGGGFGRAIAPSGASVGKWEALEKRDKSDRRYKGRGVYTAVDTVNNIIANLIRGMDSREQRRIDYKMINYDGTENKSKLGANSMIATSLAVAKACSNTLGIPLFRYIGGVSANVLPVPLMNIINGGKHAGNELAIQEFMIVPVGADRFSEALRIGCEVYYELKNYLRDKYGLSAINVGDEGGFSPPMRKTEEALDALIRAIEKAGYTTDEVRIALDCAATTFYDSETGTYKIDGKTLQRMELVDFLVDLCDRYPIISIEDPLEEEDFYGFSVLREKLKKTIIVGDDIFVTNPKRLKKGIETGSADAILIKPNQIGTLTETLDVVALAKQNGYKIIISHRSGETEDTTIADLAVGLSSGIIKTGAPARGERTSKYNRLIRIEDSLGSASVFLGAKALEKRG